MNRIAARSKSLVAAVALVLATATTPQPAGATQVVFMNFNEFLFYPGITTEHFSDGLLGFDASAFTLLGGPDPDMATIIQNVVLAKVREDFADFDIEFVTQRPDPPTPFVQWGIDDTAYTFRSGDALEAGSLVDDSRLYGIADRELGIARSFAGSFALTANNQPYGGVGPNTLSDSPLGAINASDPSVHLIGQALANNAAHEIAHLFGAGHDDIGFSLMSTQNEATMASVDKYFVGPTREALLDALGPSDGNAAEMNSGSPVSLSQTVVVPESEFAFHEPGDHHLSFDYLFKSTSGELTVTLGGEVVVTIPAPSTLLGEFTTQLVSLDGILTEPGAIDLTFTIDETVPGEQASVLLDSILLSGLENGHFRGGDLSSWTASAQGAGSVQVVRLVPEPGTTLLAAAGLSMMGVRRRARGRRRRQSDESRGKELRLAGRVTIPKCATGSARTPGSPPPERGGDTTAGRGCSCNPPAFPPSMAIGCRT